MTKKQQEETLKYFKDQASDWKEKADGLKENQVNVIRQRNNYVLEVIKKRSETSVVLDVGCGSGDLVHDAAAMGIKAIGVDFSDEMIEIANTRSSELGTESNTEFHCASIFDFEIEEQHLDLLSANGFIEYINYKQLDDFLDLAHKGLKANGSLVFGSRNRLFNVFSVNQFTTDELEDGTVSELLSEAVALTTIKDLKELLDQTNTELQNEDHKHSNTGIDVTTRLQFTPSQLVKMLDKKGFDSVELYPVHVHGVVPSFKEAHAETHYYISNLLNDVLVDDPKNRNLLIPYASSFMIHAVKR